MSPAERSIMLHSRLFLTGHVEVLTGLHIGASREALNIGGLDNPVVRDPLSNRPYIPGSSLKGKLRSLLEKQNALDQNQSIGEGVSIHVCFTRNGKGEKVADPEAYSKCPVCPVFGTPAEFAVQPTRLLVRDVLLDDSSATALQRARTDLPFTEVKWEAAIDRMTSVATPRQMERVPAGAVFAPMEMVYNVHEEPRDFERFTSLLLALQLLEDDYLGGLGSRGSGKIAFKELHLYGRRSDTYHEKEDLGTFNTLKDLLNIAAGLPEQLKAKLGSRQK